MVVIIYYKSHIGREMKHSAIPLSVRLPVGADAILNELISNLQITKAQFIRNAIIEKIEDALDIAEIEQILAKKEKTFSMDEIKRELSLVH